MGEAMRLSRRRLGPDWLTGRTITRAELTEDGALMLILGAGYGAPFALVMADPEGNGPGSLHVFTGDHPNGCPIGGR